MSPGTASFGRVIVDEQGIRQRRILGLFGRKFALNWEQIIRWARAEAVLRTGGKGNERIIARILELHHRGGIEQVCWTGAADKFDSLVACLRQRLPKKQTDSLLAKARPEMYNNR